MTILCDVDGVVADLLSRWLRLYNQDYDDCLTPADITSWETNEFVKPECGKRIFHYLDRADLYDGVLPIEGARVGVQELRAMGHRVVYVTACSSGVMAKGKIEWLFRHDFLTDMKDLMVARDKSLAKGDLMIDDYIKNLRDFGGRGVLFDAPYNRHIGGFPRALDWEGVLTAVAVYASAA